MYKMTLLELMAGRRHARAEANGLSRAGHVREQSHILPAITRRCADLIEHAARDLMHAAGRTVARCDYAAHQRREGHLEHNYHQAGKLRARNY